MSRKITSFCAVLLLTLTLVSAAQRRLNSINELNNCHQGESIRRLLYWFANCVDIRNNVIWLTFDPQRQYGSHHYGNYEDLLEHQPWDCKYYTVGNIREDTSESLPSYVRNSQRGTNRWNRARIIFRANNNRRIDRVFITQHSGSGEDTSYDPERTFEVSIDLLQEFRRQPHPDGSQGGSFGNTAHFQGQYQYYNQHHYTPQPNTRNNGMDSLCTFCVCALIIVCLFIFISAISLSHK